MRSRVARLMIAALILAVGAGAAVQITFLLDQLNQLSDGQRSSLFQISRFDTLAGDLAAAQAGYVAPGQPNAPWVERAARLTSDLSVTLSAIHIAARSADAPAELQSIADAISQSAAADASARAHLEREEDLLAADIVFGEGRDAIDAARQAASALAMHESAFFDAERAGVQQRMLLTAAGAAAVAGLGLLVLAPLPRQRSEPSPIATSGSSMSSPLNLSLTPPEPISTPAIDLTKAADLCTALSRLDSAAALPGMLARVSALLDASGLIVWMAAGNELIAATSHGYDPRIISRLGAIPRDADNATADAWRTGEMRTVSGDVMSNGAIVAPMFTPDTCVGVVAAEVRHGREQDASTQAVTMMVAAQLATVLGAWPATPPVPAVGAEV